MNDVEVKDLIEKAHQSLEAAKLLFDEGFIDFSASRVVVSGQTDFFPLIQRYFH
ncbi:MAG TPA: hypothetical protein VK469_02775 [Candidatus Kapabacteria bacterium]|nr:hypothetical protein [Candidatus Kapabacteria bacterium]